MLRSLQDLQLCDRVPDSRVQTEGALTLKAFADDANDIRGTVSNSLSVNCSEHPGVHESSETTDNIVSYDCQFVVDPLRN